MKKSFTTVATLLIILMAAACSHYKEVTTTLVKEKNVVIELIRYQGPGGEVLKKGYAQPVSVAPADIATVLKSLTYSDPVFMWKEKNRPIFSESEADLLALHLTTALAQANADQMIYFSISTWKKDLIFGTEKFTNGYLFLPPGRINWVFANVNLVFNQDGEKFTGNPMGTVPKGIRLTESEGLHLYRPPGQKWYEPKEFPNWLEGPTPFQTGPVLPSDKPAEDLIVTTPGVGEAVAETFAESKAAPEQVEPAKAKATAKPPAAKPAPQAASKGAASEDAATVRLRRLKTLFDDKLISEQDYIKKKNEILKDL